MFGLMADLFGMPCWGVKAGFGCNLKLQFGQPHLEVREPIAAAGASARVRAVLARRSVRAIGEWLLWIHECDWIATNGGKVVGSSASARAAEAGARALDGQQLIGVTLRPRGARTSFLFDLGGILETRPYGRTFEQWFLFMPGERVLAFRGDRHYRVSDADRSVKEHSWRAA